MERFEMANDKGLNSFNNFVSKAKDTFKSLSEDIKDNIALYESAINDTEEEILNSEMSRKKCEEEIAKMEKKIVSIKEAIDNVESTYQKIVDAYSSTSKGDTKDLYSDIINEAKENCDRDVEKNRTEIAQLNSDIEAIKNNIAELTKTISELKKELEGYKVEVDKYRKALNYIERNIDDIGEDLDSISESKLFRYRSQVKGEINHSSSIEEPIKKHTPIANEEKDEKPVKEEVIEIEEPLEIEKAKTEDDDSLQRIYDLTGYKPTKREESKEEKELYSGNLENLFIQSGLEDIKPEPLETNEFSDDTILEWEKMLNENNILKPDKESSTNKMDDFDTVNQLLKPYGTNYNRLKELIANEIIYKDGTKKRIEIDVEDIIKAINAVDGNDLKAMKIVGPEITLLRKIKKIKEEVL